MYKIIKSDLYRHGGLHGFAGFIKGIFIPGFRYMFFLRLAQLKRKRSFLGIIYRLILRRYSFKYGIQIPVSTEIGEGFYIGHFGNIVISSRASLGKFCNIAHGVTIGMTSRGKSKGSPQIGNFVWIGTGSVIVGKIVIGDNVLIAPLSYVNFDVPANSIVIGTPAKIISREDATNGYINFINYK